MAPTSRISTSTSGPSDHPFLSTSSSSSVIPGVLSGHDSRKSLPRRRSVSPSSLSSIKAATGMYDSENSSVKSDDGGGDRRPKTVPRAFLDAENIDILENSFIDFSDPANRDDYANPIVRRKPVEVVVEANVLEYESTITLDDKSGPDGSKKKKKKKSKKDKKDEKDEKDKKKERKKKKKKKDSKQIHLSQFGSITISGAALLTIQKEQEEAAAKANLNLRKPIDDTDEVVNDLLGLAPKPKSLIRNVNKHVNQEEVDRHPNYQPLPPSPPPPPAKPQPELQQQANIDVPERMPRYRHERYQAEALKLSNFDWSASTKHVRDEFKQELLVRIVRGEQLPPPATADEAPVIDDSEAIAEHNRAEAMKILALMNGNDSEEEEEEVPSNESIDHKADKAKVNDDLAERKAPRIIPKPTVERPANVDSFVQIATQPIPLPAGNRDHPPDMLHTLVCLTCGSWAAHVQTDCVEHPQHKLSQIRRKRLCKRCLSDEHSYIKCGRNDILCSVCGMDHLDYVYHQGDWLMSSSEAPPTSSLPDSGISECSDESSVFGSSRVKSMKAPASPKTTQILSIHEHQQIDPFGSLEELPRLATPLPAQSSDAFLPGFSRVSNSENQIDPFASLSTEQIPVLAPVLTPSKAYPDGPFAEFSSEIISSAAPSTTAVTPKKKIENSFAMNDENVIYYSASSVDKSAPDSTLIHSIDSSKTSELIIEPSPTESDQARTEVADLFGSIDDLGSSKTTINTEEKPLIDWGAATDETRAYDQEHVVFQMVQDIYAKKEAQSKTRAIMLTNSFPLEPKSNSDISMAAAGVGPRRCFLRN